MKYILIVLSFCFITLPLYSQSINVSVADGYDDYNLTDFPIYDGKISINQNQILLGDQQFLNPVAWAISPKGYKVSFLENRGGLIFHSINYDGQKLTENEMEFFNAADETIALYQFEDGRAVIRDNVANFTFLDPMGNTVFSESNSTQSPDGERESQLASDKYGRTIVLYNPVIRYGDQIGSRAKLVFGDQDHEIFYRDDEREIVQVSVSEKGKFITILTQNGSGSRALFYDRFGNELNRMDFEDLLEGVRLSRSGEFLTAYTSGRVQVFNQLTGERLGSASSRATIIHAEFQPEDETVIIIGGSLNGGQVSNPSLTAVHLSRRQIAREEIGYDISLLSPADIQISRISNGEYRIDGLNRPLLVQAGW